MKRSQYDKRQSERLAELRRRVQENAEFPKKPRISTTRTDEFIRAGRELVRIK